MTDINPGEVVETTRAYQYTTDRSAPRHFASGRFVVDAANRITGTLYVHREGLPAKRWNAFLIDATDASRPAPGELAEEYGR